MGIGAETEYHPDSPPLVTMGTETTRYREATQRLGRPLQPAEKDRSAERSCSQV